MKIRLDKEWKIGEQLDKGGFGVVRLASSDEEPNAVAKFIPKAPGAERELLFGDLGSARNIVPILDSGETEDSWVLVMPRGERNLRHYIDKEGPAVSVDAARSILTDIVTTLVDLDGKVVHRDLKPENVIQLNGRWCLSDFGISRYTEATTAPDTHKFAMSPPYAAPERWRSERATTAADVYAVGVIGYEMLAGRRPFAGSGHEDFREQHLHAAPGALEQVDASMASLVEECLIKAPGARPSPENLLARLERSAATPSNPGLARLQEANRTQTNRAAEAARRASEANTEGERRTALYEAADTSLRGMADKLVSAIESAAPASAVGQAHDGARSVKLGPAELRIFALRECIAGQGRSTAIDVIACSTIGVAMPPDHYGYEGRSHSLWFCDAQVEGEYGWFETAFMISPLMAQQTNRDPFALAPDAEAAEALAPVVAARQVAWPFTRLDDEGQEDFIGRWAGWLADASEGRLHRPTTMPERSPDGSWRRS